VGAGCVELGAHSAGAGSRRAHRRHPASASAARAADGQGIAASLVTAPDRPVGRQAAGALGGIGGTASLTPAAKASREFGPEQVGVANAVAADAAQGSDGARARPHASAAGASRRTRARPQSLDAGLRAPAAGTAAAGSASGGASSAGFGGTGEAAENGSGDSSAAQREFSPG
jgi:hypothetical protein